MARGWESKSVEEQQSQATPAPLSKEDLDRIRVTENASKMRSIQALTLTRARIVEQLQRSQNERYNELLNRELAHIDAQLKDLKS